MYESNKTNQRESYQMTRIESETQDEEELAIESFLETLTRTFSENYEW